MGWYHSHPGFGCWLSSVDVNTQQVSNTLQYLSLPPNRLDPGFTNRFFPVSVNRADDTQSFEQLHPRAVAVVVDPIQSVRGKVVIDAFRSINPHSIMSGQESRQTTSNIGHLNKPSIQALIHGLNRHYYSK